MREKEALPQPGGQRPGGRLRQMLAAQIPKRAPAGAVLAFFDLLRGIQRLRGRRFDHLAANRAAFAGHRAAITAAGGYIEDQHHYTDLCYGTARVEKCGCAPIAVYNALRALAGHEASSLPVVLDALERDGIAANGRFGTAPRAVEAYFVRRGMPAKTQTKPPCFDALLAGARCGILTYFNDRENVAAGAHTVCLTKDGTGGLWIHNTKAGCVGPYPTVKTLLEAAAGTRARPIALTGIQ